MSGKPKDFIHFLDALETHENFLHAETQAIAAKHLDTIESILVKKEESLKLLLEAKENIGFDPRTNQKADQLIERVLELQKRNSDSFKRLVDSQPGKKKLKENSNIKPIDEKLKRAYQENTFRPNSRLKF